MLLEQPKKLFPVMLVALAAGVILYACQREPEQPIVAASKKATLVVEVMHHHWTVPGIPVYLKKDATEFPGMDTASYDLLQVTNQGGNVQFRDLIYGNYYLFVSGWDPVFNDSVIGYKPVVINDSSAAGGIVDDRIFVSE